MSKRLNEDQSPGRNTAAKSEANAAPGSANKIEAVDGDVDMGEFEDPYSDEYESDEEIVEIDDQNDNEEEEEGKDAQDVIKKDEGEQTSEPTIYLPHKSRPLGPDEVLEADPSVYNMLHNVNLPWPCLTLDVLPDHLGDERRNYPASLYVTTATQASKKKDNELLVLKLSQLSKTLVKDENENDDEEEDDEDEFDGEPIMESESIPLHDTTNRIRVSPHGASTGEYFTATSSENGEVLIYDLSSQYKAFDQPGFTIPKNAKKPIHTIRNHGNVEGYGLDWSPLIKTGSLLSGDCSGRVYLTNRTSSNWVTDKTPFTVDNNESIEDIQWSKAEQTVFATAGTDGYIRIWDTRSKKHKPAISVVGSQTDINVISWSEKINYLLASGDDDGKWGIWDLRNFKPGQQPSPVAQYDFHKSAITSISFNPLDESIIAVSSEDNTVTLWDLSVEADDEEIKQQRANSKELEGIPPQLLFVHWQKDVKDVQWHKQIPGALVSTGTDGLNVWKTISV
ncbi:putative WD repeat-containing protein [Wickerhamomyces ciferrii]|uniref:WD repeat-containing protein n=1 Tax=Wickerhamomyces ciferrii (strain ATCC 14091 / BCRC 22168 / CBS 111 / JCM 3599 / NBRC 0793 / NRRL Y-1031 F-60-10) TaxID=1206466 RepID=K0KUH3_WICCF|nr:putative WD repeat-containing protein [Wickerhamomyces ciferrii]CCH44843.1 putative WD repeat-containing protein [Wickerhamomyces ciferrii]